MSKPALKLRILLKRLKFYGIDSLSKRGKGSEIILIKPTQPDGKKGPIYPIKNHGMGTEISSQVIDAILRRFDIDKDEFWKK